MLTALNTSCESILAATPFRSEKRSAAQHGDAEEEAKIVPAAFVGNGINGDIRVEQRPDKGPRENKTVPHPPQKTGRSRILGHARINLRCACGECQQ